MSTSQPTPSTTPAPDASGIPFPAPATPSNGMGTAALIIGIVAFVGAFIPFINYGSGLLAIVGVVLGAIALTRKAKARRSALIGLIVSAVAVLLSIILAIAYTASFINAVDDSLGTAISAPAASDASSDDAADEAPAAGSDVGTRENPAPLGSVVELSSGGSPEYEVTLGASNLAANDIIAAENQFNDAPAAGFQYAMIPVTVTYKGTETGTPWIDVTVEFVSAAGTTHTTSDTLAVGPAPSMMDINDLYPDASGTGNVVIAIPTADAALGTWTVSTIFGDTYFFAAQ
ncbi:DUF4190 domain-containing protein [Cryobacterium sp. PH31-O1]|uniref:DUF4190 domain-containing protein n=1 Tax=Cryobacterium sp. PH31-O1 TaxID=3046306 RepID=UPI0024B8FDB0|nr:DUF4190 domain-containing protein [Cryobacterium sp. PH31-O1]MDJ0339352.1 DUF4190 domain-containing protein [Cryobacterium sp. PH31-O1]